jgi:ParB-like chromosome segregation protein Spo0J
MDDLTIAWRPLGGLIPYARNPRNHSDAQVAQIAGSIKEFGWTNPVLVDGANGIVAGHGRVLAARKLGLDRVPVIELAHMSEAQKRAYILADNQLAANAGWDEELLRLELADLSELGFDLGLVGFGPGELERLLAGDGRTGLSEDDGAPARSGRERRSPSASGRCPGSGRTIDKRSTAGCRACRASGLPAGGRPRPVG